MQLRRPKGDALVLVALLLAVLAVQLFHVDRQGELVFQHARVISGDEPHYLVHLNSIFRDGDLELANNYKSVRRGSQQAGERLAGTGIRHHSVWAHEGEIQHWFEFYVDGETGEEPPLRAGVKPPEGHPEYPWNSPGMPIVTSPLVRVLTVLVGSVEGAAVLASGLAMFGVFLLFLCFVRNFFDDDSLTPWAVATMALATPLLAYSRLYFPETYLSLLFLLSYLAFFRWRLYWLAGAAIGLAGFIKFPALVLGLPLWVYLLRDRDLRSAMVFAVLPLMSVLATLALNHHFFGNPLLFANIFVWGPFFSNVFNTLFDARDGLFSTAPILVVACLGWKELWLTHRRLCIAFLAGLIPYLLFFASRNDYSGGYSPANRYLLPFIPILCPGLIPAWTLIRRRPWMMVGAAMLLVASLGLSLRLAFTEDMYW